MILVTGANGFVGRSLVKRLVELRLEVRGGARTSSRSSDSVVMPQLGREADWFPLLDQVDSVVHLAGRAHVLRETAKCPAEIFQEVNTAGTIRLAEQAAEVGIRRFVFLSSVGVNGVRSLHPFTESDLPAPQEPYAVSKLEAERALLTIAERSAMEIVILRPPLVYGPGAPGNFGRLLDIVRRGIPLPFGSFVHNRRTLVGIDNLVDLIIKCINHPAAANQIFMAGDNEDLSTAGLIRRLAHALEVEPRNLPIPVSVITAMASVVGKRAQLQKICGNLQVNTCKSRDLLGWTPPLSVDEGLRRAALR